MRCASGRYNESFVLRVFAGRPLTSVFGGYRGNQEIVVLIKIDREAPFNSMVHIIDELDLAGLTRFSLATLTPDERREVEAL